MKLLYRIEAIICVFFILCATGVLFINVIFRNFGLGIEWSQEFIRYSFIWITFIGGAICVRYGGHVSIDVVDSFLKEKSRKVILFIATTFSLVFLIWVFLIGVEAVYFNYSNGQTTPTLSIPIYLVYLAIPLGFLLMIVHYIEILIKLIKKERSKE